MAGYYMSSLHEPLYQIQDSSCFVCMTVTMITHNKMYWPIICPSHTAYFTKKHLHIFDLYHIIHTFHTFDWDIFYTV